MLLTPPFQRSHPQEKAEISWIDVFLCFKKLFIASLVMASLSSPTLLSYCGIPIAHASDMFTMPPSLFDEFSIFSLLGSTGVFLSAHLYFSDLMLCCARSARRFIYRVIDFRYTVFYSSGISIWFFKYFISLVKILIFLMHLFCPWCLYFL